MDKQQLRTRLRAARTASARVAIVPPPEFTALLRPGTIVASYIPTGSEADPVPLTEAARAAGCPIVLPHVVDRALPLRFLLWGAGAPLADGPYGLRQPQIDAEELAPTLILTPLVGFDRAGNRLGQGAGHYDRAFATHPEAIRIGIAYSVQEVPTLPADPWDVPLHHIVTDKEWITPMDPRS